MFGTASAQGGLDHWSHFNTDRRTRMGSGGRNLVKASMDWHASSGAQFSAGTGYTGFAHLQHYTARYCVWGDGPPLVLVPGLAGGFEFLGPLARLLARHFQAISY